MRNKHIIYHPGEINKVRDLPRHPGVVATITDPREGSSVRTDDLPGSVFVWNFGQQPAREAVVSAKTISSIKYTRVIEYILQRMREGLKAATHIQQMNWHRPCAACLTPVHMHMRMRGHPLLL